MNEPPTAGAEPSSTQVAALQGWTLLEFGSSWCGICARAQPAIQAAVQQHPGIHHIKIEDGPGRPLGRSFGIKLWPTLVLLQDGQEVGRAVRPAHLQAVLQLLQAAP